MTKISPYIIDVEFFLSVSSPNNDGQVHKQTRHIRFTYKKKTVGIIVLNQDNGVRKDYGNTSLAVILYQEKLIPYNTREEERKQKKFYRMLHKHGITKDVLARGAMDRQLED